jgi:hypothetical protein
LFVSLVLLMTASKKEEETFLGRPALVAGT